MVEAPRISLIELVREFKRKLDPSEKEGSIPVLKRIYSTVVRVTREHGTQDSFDESRRYLTVDITDPDQPTVTVLLMTETPRGANKSADIEVVGLGQKLQIIKTWDGEIEGVLIRRGESLVPLESMASLERSLQYKAVIERVKLELSKKSPVS